MPRAIAIRMVDSAPASRPSGHASAASPSRSLVDESFEDGQRVRERAALVGGQAPDAPGEEGGLPGAAARQHVATGVGDAHAGDAAVSRVDLAFDETVLLEAADDARHARRLDLLEGGELPERDRAAILDGGEGAET